MPWYAPCNIAQWGQQSHLLASVGLGGSKLVTNDLFPLASDSPAYYYGDLFNYKVREENLVSSTDNGTHNLPT